VSYRISDEKADPPENQRYCSEKLLYIDDCFLVFSPPENSPEIIEAPCVKNGYVTFGSFNAMAKINTETIELWSAILNNIPDSRLILKNISLSDEGVKERVSHQFEVNNINKERLEFLSFEKTLNGHLDAYNKVDIGLDTFPYNGTTTTCEALWMGVPVVTLNGQISAARVGNSIMTCLGLKSFVASNKREYIKICRYYAANTGSIVGLKRSLRNIMSDSKLCNAPEFVKKLENALCYVLEKA